MLKVFDGGRYSIYQLQGQPGHPDRYHVKVPKAIMRLLGDQG
jgi:hypothetical protein